MNLNEVRTEIAAIKIMLSDMVTAGEIPVEYALPLAQVLLTQVLCRNSVKAEYVPDP